MPRTQKYHVQAFSLIELLVTIVIVGILASMAVASYDKFRGYAYQAEIINYAHEFDLAASALVSSMAENIAGGIYLDMYTLNGLVFELRAVYRETPLGPSISIPKSQLTPLFNDKLTGINPDPSLRFYLHYLNQPVPNTIYSGAFRRFSIRSLLHCKLPLNARQYLSGEIDNIIIKGDWGNNTYAFSCPA